MINSEEIFLNANQDAIAVTDQNLAMGFALKEQLTNTQTLLKTLPDQLSCDVMVPLGPRASVRGKIVHTNEFLVSLGGSYFVKRTAKQSLEVCQRKMDKCDEVLDKLQKQRNLYESMMSVPKENEAFGSKERPEIFEHVTEDEDKEWRKSHRLKEQEYRKKLADMRAKEKQQVNSEEDLWKRLDELELEEELEDELLRLHNGSNSDESDQSDEEEPPKVEEPTVENSELKKDTVVKRKRSVVFINEDENERPEDPLILNFKHSEVLPKETINYSGEILKPSDIYLQYTNELKQAIPPSILKVKNNPNRDKEWANVSGDEDVEEVEAIETRRVIRGMDLPEVTEKRYFEVKTVPTAEEKPKRISKFKASRMKKLAGH